MPNGQETRQLRRFAGSCRFVYNKALAINTQRYEKKEKRLGYAELCALLPGWKKEHPFLSDVPAQALQQSLKNLARAYTNFFEKRADETPKHPSTSAVGVDWGVVHLATLSDGEVVDPCQPLKKFLPKLAKWQRRMARKKKFSQNWRKVKARITQLYAKVANIRKDFLHTVSNDITKNHAIVVVEDLQVKSMSRSATKKVAQKSGLNRAILDASPFELRRQLE
jgi:transposase